jgi:peptidoglycan/xylan/chitin deacetylase (PgdA/CDA1 family)
MLNRVIKLTISIIFYTIQRVFNSICTLIGKEIPPTLVILTYHPIKASVTELFEKQMNLLLNVGKPFALTGDFSKLSNKYNIAVTFDDGYQSVLENALPILRSKNISATIFIPSGFLGKKPLWIKNSDHFYASETVLSELQLKSLPADLITIGSHTVSHIDLAKADEETTKKEVFESKQALEKLINKEVTLFAAPYALLNQKFVHVFRETGYKRVFLNIPTFPSTNTDSYILGRTSVEPTDWPIEYRLKLAGAYQWLAIAVNLKRKLMRTDGF